MNIKTWLKKLGLAQRAQTSSLEDGRVAYERKDFTAALRILRPLADQGDAAAQFNLGVMYDKGQGLSQNFSEAVKWYRLSADQGLRESQCSLGNMYNLGKGVSIDHAEAVKWYRLAADQGDTEAQEWLAPMYQRGHGVPRDSVQAYVSYELAATRKPALNNGLADFFIKMRDDVAKHMTSAQIAEAQRLAREWLEAHPKP
jgi:TPR repeat protein